MKIFLNPTIINGTNYTEEAIESLLDSMFISDMPILSSTGDVIDLPHFRQDIIVNDEGIHIPSSYDESHIGTAIDDPSEYTVVDYKLLFTKEDLGKRINELING